MNIHASKIGYIVAAAAIGASIFAGTAMAATTASLAPASISVTAGQQFNVVVSVDPAGTKNFAEKLVIDYPADLLQVSSFNLGSNWMALTQTGYDSTDNASGVLTKTAGYASGISTLMPFGTITFTAMKSGNGAISVGSNSQAFLASGQTTITGNGASIVIGAAAAVKQTTVKSSAPKASSLAPVSTINGSVVVPTTTQDLIDQQAAVAMATGSSSNASGTVGSTGTIIAILVIIVIVAAGAYLFTKKKKY